MSTMVTREDFTSRFYALAREEIYLDDLRRWFTPLLVDGDIRPGAGKDLKSSLVYLFEDDSIGPAVHVDNARRLVPYLESALSEDQVLWLLPLILLQHRLCDVVGKYKRGVVSRTGFVTFVSSSRLSGGIKKWLTNASPDALTGLCEALESGTPSEIAGLLENPPVD